MSTRHPSQFRRLCGVGLCVVLVVGAGTPVAFGETPEERCKRETEAYNRLWQDAWVRNHPKEVAKGQQPPSPTPPTDVSVTTTYNKTCPATLPHRGLLSHLLVVPRVVEHRQTQPPTVVVELGKVLPQDFSPNPPPHKTKPHCSHNHRPKPPLILLSTFYKSNRRYEGTRLHSLRARNYLQHLLPTSRQISLLKVPSFFGFSPSLTANTLIPLPYLPKTNRYSNLALCAIVL